MDLKVLLSSKFKAEHSWENLPLFPSSPPTHMCFAHVQEMFSVAKIIFVQKRQIIQDFLVHLQAYT